MNKLKFLVTGTGKCGTVYMANLLSELEIHCGHEAIFTNQGLDEAKKRLNNSKLIKFSECTKNLPKWTNPQSIIADSSYMAAPFLDWEQIKETKIIYLIRNPIKVISSFIKGNYFNSIWPKETVSFQKFIKLHAPQVYDNNLDCVNRCAIFYIEWNKIIEKKIENKEFIIQRIEDKFEKVYDFLEKKPKKTIKISTKINSWHPTKEVKFMDLIPETRKNIVEFCKKYKYHKPLFI